MSSTVDYIEFVISQIDESRHPQYRKMFGDYMVYIKGKPLFLVCDNIVYVKELDSLKGLLAEADKGHPYQGAREHYIVDVEDRELLEQLVVILEQEIPIPVKKPRRKHHV